MRTLITARYVQLDAERAIEGGGVLLEGGAVAAVGAERDLRRSAGPDVRRVELGAALLGAGWINAHAHLELGALAGAVPAGEGFGDWIGGVLAARGGCTRAGLERGLHEGLVAARASGTTRVLDIDSMGLATPEAGARRVRHRELLDAGDATRCAAQLKSLSEAASSAGLSPHAPYTVSTELLAGIVGHARGLRAPRFAVHWAETEDEREWWAGGGALAQFLGRGPDAGQRAWASALEWMLQLGLPLARTAFVHGNHPAPGDVQRLGEAGALVVHCPGSHAFFGRGQFDQGGYRAAGVALALGTDSLASNASLDLRREARLMRDAHPGLGPREVWPMLTEHAATFLGLPGGGRLVSGAPGDLCAFATEARTAEAALDEVTAGAAAVRGVWIGGAGGPTPRAGPSASVGQLDC